MPPLRPLNLALRAIRRPYYSAQASRHGAQVIIRSCSCSAPQQLQHTVTVTSQVPAKAGLNTTTSEPPIPPTDHRTLAQAQNLFITSPYSPGSPLLLPNGAYVFQRLQAFLRAQYPRYGFREVITPTIYKKSLWQKSGHWENYAEDMFSVHGRGATGEAGKTQIGEDEEFGLKPMNCPGHCLLFRDEIKSYRDLPIRYADFSALHRNEVSGALTGLTRVRRFHQDDAHIFCRPDQILSEIELTLQFVGMVYRTFGLGSYRLLLSTRPKDSYIGTVEEWDRAEQQLTAALNNSGSPWAISEGDGAFYGPKIDIVLKDSNGKEHQTATIQLDFQLPQRFDLQYQASPEELEAGSQTSLDAGLESTMRRPVMVHRAIYGSIERFMALLIELYAGEYPFWLSPRPAIILSLNSDPKVLAHVARAQSILSGSVMEYAPTRKVLFPHLAAQYPIDIIGMPDPIPLSTTQLPVDVDTSDRPLGKKVAEARAKKYNNIIVVGGKEAESERVNLRILSNSERHVASDVLGHVLGKKTSTELTESHSINLTLGDARKYFRKLVELYV